MDNILCGWKADNMLSWVISLSRKLLAGWVEVGATWNNIVLIRIQTFLAGFYALILRAQCMISNSNILRFLPLKVVSWVRKRSLDLLWLEVSTSRSTHYRSTISVIFLQRSSLSELQSYFSTYYLSAEVGVLRSASLFWPSSFSRLPFTTVIVLNLPFYFLMVI